jgi:phosphopantothenoylcysteine decarboxylase/phosphopantothenate--cysteine ligase
MKRLANKRLVLGITGSIAAYKAAELLRRLREAGAEVQVVMTTGAQAFVSPLTFQSLSGRAVRSELIDTAAEAAMGHIELARWADAILVAPASADFIARLVQGRADDLLTAVCLASEAPLALAPAMNRVMWQAAATRDNVATLAARGVRVLGPDSGPQACGETGEGRMLEPSAITELLDGMFASGALDGLNVLVTAGPTFEDIDPVRFIGNRSSGRMGFALATAAAEAGARVTLVAGPVALETPERVTRIDVRSALQMLAAVNDRLAGCDIFIAAAAVADYRPASAAKDKIKRADSAMTLELVPNPDILASAAAREHAPFTVGFAAETSDVEQQARQKLERKGVDMIAANRVGLSDSGAAIGFDSDSNALDVFWPGGRQQLPQAPKSRLARELVTLIAENYHADKNRTQDTG